MSKSYKGIDGEIVVLGTIVPYPGKVEEVAKWLLQCQADVKANEPGTLEYTFARNGDEFLAWERYADKAALQSHFRNKTLNGMLKSGTVDASKLKLLHYKGKL